ncbi:MAG: tetratricopeptide repeat protein [Gammaproteobacteria bacterium]|nr:tetratricopeptide repeat protein [Gammaproteobacteria bacterium]
MSNGDNEQSLWEELKRRNVVRVGLAFAGAAWILVQVASVFIPALGLPDGLMTVIAVACIAGFPVALVIAWVYEWTSEGLVRDSSPRVRSGIGFGGRHIDYFIIGMLTVAVSWFALDKFYWSKSASTKIPTIAVLPFENISDDSSREYFAEGLSEEILNLLTRIEGLRVIGRTSAFQFKDRPEDLREIGQKLSADYLLEGSVRIVNQQLRINTHLVNVADGVRIWSDTFNGNFDDAFRLQELIARAAVAQLKMEFLAIVKAPDSGDAYDAYLQGLRFNRIPDAGNAVKAVHKLELSVQLDPSFAPAWLQLFRAYSLQTRFGQMTTEEGDPKMRETVSRALEADPKSADVHSALGHFEMWHNFDLAAAETAYIRALELVPEHPGALGGAAALAAARGRLDEALAYTFRVQQVDPLGLSGMHNEAFYNYLNRDYQAAEKKYRETLEFAGESYLVGRAMLALCLIAQGKYREAHSESLNEKAESQRLAVQSISLLKLERMEEAQQALDRLIEKHGDRLPIPIAGSFAQRGEFDDAIRWIERAYQQKNPQLLWLKVHPVFDPLQDDPRVPELIERLHLN